MSDKKVTFGLARKFEIYDFDANERTKVIARPSAWHAAILFQEAHEDAIPETMANPYSVYIWGYYAIKHAGLAKKYDLPKELTIEDIPKMMERYAFVSEDVSEDDLPSKGDGPLA